MSDMIKIPYLGKEYDIDFFFGGWSGCAQETKDILDGHEFEMWDVLICANRNFTDEWSKLSAKFGHLYGLWDDCIEPQIREWFGFPPIEHINEDRRHMYFECRHKDVEVA